MQAWGKQVVGHGFCLRSLDTLKKPVEDKTPPEGLHLSARLGVILELRSCELPNTICRNEWSLQAR